jgi:hypothetical protein
MFPFIFVCLLSGDGRTGALAGLTALSSDGCARFSSNLVKNRTSESFLGLDVYVLADDLVVDL